MKTLKNILDEFYRSYDFKGRLAHDPIEFPRRYADPRDAEVVAFISSALSYGKVELFKPVIEKLLSAMGPGPYEFLLEFRPEKRRGLFKGIKYRFNENEDLIALMFVLHQVLRRDSSLENVFKKYYRVGSLSIGEGLSGFVAALLETDTSLVYGKDVKPSGLKQLLPSPANGSACKRANLFLRWMVRDRDIDLGIWKGIPKGKLIVPLDTHIARISRCLGFTKRKPQDWKMAVEVTESLRRLDPEDPLKYDFALCHHGISGVCKGLRGSSECKGCAFKGR